MGKGELSPAKFITLRGHSQIAEAELTSNTMPEAAEIYLAPAKPLLHFAKRQDVVVWQPQRLTR